MIQRSKEFPIGTVFMTTDFAAQFPVEKQEEAQSESMQGTPHLKILVFVTRRHAPDSTVDTPMILEEEHFFVADGYDVEHSTWPFVQYAIERIIQKYRDMGVEFDTLFMNSDQCGGQFKSRHPFMGMTVLAAKYNLYIDWVYG